MIYAFFYSYRPAFEAGEKRHAQIVMREIAADHAFFAIKKCEPQSLFDGVYFELELPEFRLYDLKLPPYISAMPRVE